jgi:hypothetical protein
MFAVWGGWNIGLHPRLMPKKCTVVTLNLFQGPFTRIHWASRMDGC